MNIIERHYRLITIQERFAQLEGELVAIANETATGPEQDRLMSGVWHAKRAAEMVQPSAPMTHDDLAAILQLSILTVEEQKQEGHSYEP
jgi:hypothetical protein